MKRPICINEGCNQPCIPSHGKIDGSGYVRFRPYCSNCFNANRGKAELKEGVVAFQKHKCSNLDGHLGFLCIIGKEGHKRINKLVSKLQMFQLDHKDGNPLNNSKENVEELCVMCHKHKSVMHNDYAPFRKIKKKKACKRSKLQVLIYERRPTLSEHSLCSRAYARNATRPRLERVS